MFVYTAANREAILLVTYASLASLAVHENSFANPFSDFQIERQKGNPKNPDLDFLIEIHPEDGFLGGEIRFRISRSIGKSEFRF